MRGRVIIRLWKANFTFLKAFRDGHSGLAPEAGTRRFWQKGGKSMKNRIEEIRKKHGMNQEELADALEVSRQTIGSLENGRYNPSIILAFKIARYFDMSIEEIFLYEEESG